MPISGQERCLGRGALKLGGSSQLSTGRHKVRLLFYYVITLLALSVAAGGADGASPRWVTVDKAIDGDTLILSDGRRIRLIGIDAPEINHREGKAESLAIEAWHGLGRLVNGQKVRLEFDVDPKDSHGRVLAYVYDERGGFINRRVIDQGLAHVLYVVPNGRAFEALLDAQRAAMDSKIGIWQNLEDDHQGPWVGNRYSKRFHRPQCRLGQQIASANKVGFKNLMEAFRQGYSPCKHCNPVPKKELKHP